MNETKPRRAVGDMKAGLTGARPSMTIVPRAAQIYLARALEYGAAKYARGNYHGPPPEKLIEKYGPEVAPVMRVLGYLDALGRHSSRISDAVNRALGTGADVREAFANAIDTEASGNFPASMLHDLSHAMACIALAISCAVDDKLLPDDLGQPWTAAMPGGEVSLPQKDDPASERRRIEDLAKRPIRGHEDPGYRFAVPEIAKPDHPAEPQGPTTDDAEARVAMAARARLEDEGVLPQGGGPGGVRW